MTNVAQLKADFRNFVYHIWHYLALPDPTPIQYDMANHLQYSGRRIILMAFRGVGKSWITSTYVCWLLLNDPHLKILVVSASKERADAFSTFTKRLINEVPVLQHLRPRDDQRNSNVSFDVNGALPAHASSVKSVGITGQLTGSRANVIIADDVETPTNSLTQGMRDRLGELIKEFDSVLNPNGRIIYLGTPQCEMSVYNTLQERGYQCKIWTALYPSPADVEKKYTDKLADIIADNITPENIGKPTDPKRFSESDLTERQASYGRSGFALQFMLDTTLSDAERYPLKLTDFITFDCDLMKAPVRLAWGSGDNQVIRGINCVGLTGDRYYAPLFVSPDWTEYQGCVMAIDPSGRGGDETGYAIIKMLYGTLYLVAVGGLKGGYELATLEALAKYAKQHGVNKVIIESNFGDGMFTKIISPVFTKIHPCAIEEIRHNIQKEKRIIDTLEPVLNAHKLVLNKSIIKSDYDSTDVPALQFLYQLTRLTRDRGSIAHDDRLDAVAMAVAYWVEQMGVNEQDQESQHLDALLQSELDKFIETATGVKPTRDNWIATDMPKLGSTAILNVF